MAKKPRQTEIVDAAQELFSTYGFEKTSMTDIARKLGVSKASLYYYFSDKESIIQSLAVKEQEQFIEEIQAVMSETMGAGEKLTFYSGKRVELLQRGLTLSSTNLIKHSAIKSIFSSIIGVFKKKEIDMVAEIIGMGIEKGEFLEIESKEHAELYLDILSGLRKNAFLTSGNFELGNMPSGVLEKVHKQTLFFTKIFIQGISK